MAIAHHHQRGVFPCGIPASRSVIQDIERNCSTSGGLGMRSTKAISLAWDSAIGYVWVAIAARLESLVSEYLALRYMCKPNIAKIFPNQVADASAHPVLFVRPVGRLPHTLGDLEATARCVPVLTTFFYRNTNNFGKKRFYNQAGFRVVSGGRGKRTTVPING
jgi:hypothetical protein